MVAVVERGEVFVVLYFFFLQPRQNFYLVLLLYGFYSNMKWSFVLQFSSSPFDFCLLPFLMGAFVGEVDFDDLEANLFSTVRFLQLGRFC